MKPDLKYLLVYLSMLSMPGIGNAQYCIPAYENICAENAYYISYIESFSINTLKNMNSGCNGNPNNYINYPASEFTTQLEQGGEYEVMIHCRSEHEVGLYFDFNKDFDFRDAGEFYNLGTASWDSAYYAKITIPASAIGNVRMRVRMISSDHFPTDDCRLLYWGETEDYTVEIVSPFTMSHVQTSVIQDSSFVFPGTTEQKIIGVEVETQGSLSSLTLTDLQFNTSVTTDLQDISNARVFYTGTDREFAAGMEFGTAVSAPNGDFSFSGSQELQQGKNFFWLVYDVREEAYLDNFVDASCVSVKVSGVDYIPLNPDPSGKRQVFDYTLIKNASETVDRLYFFDDGFNENYTWTSYTFTVYPKQTGGSVQVEFLEFNTCEVPETGCDYLHIYNGNSTSAPLIGTYYDIFPGTVVSTAVDGSLTFHLEIGTSGGEYSRGWKALITNIVNLPFAAISGNARIRPGETASLSLALTGMSPYTIIYSNGTDTDTLTGITTNAYSLTVSEPGTYTIVKILDGLNREGTFSGTGTVEWINEMKAPEGVSPNGDAYNEFFVIEGVEGKKVALYVYNREGGLVFNDENYSNLWDGKNNSGEKLPDGTYYYVIWVEGEKTIKSYVEIRR